MMLGALAAVALAQASAGDRVAPYRAQGSGPSWTLTIADGRITYEEADRPAVTVPAPRPQTEDGQIRYITRPLKVDIMPVACTDEVSGQRYSDAVFVTVGRELQSGCGGILLAADSLNGTSWHFVEIAGETVPLTGDPLRDDVYAIDFGADGFVGYGGCNRFSAGYTRSGDMMMARPPWGRTVGVCSEALMSHEQKLLQILSAPVRIGFPDASTLVLTGENGTLRLRRSNSH